MKNNTKYVIYTKSPLVYMGAKGRTLQSQRASMYNYFFEDDERYCRSIHAQRGHFQRHRRGFPSGVAPQGYLNVKIEGRNKLSLDFEHATLLRKGIDMYLDGNASVKDVLRYLNDGLGYKTRKTSKRGGKPINRGMLLNVLTSPVYLGMAFDKSAPNTWIGKRYEPMMTLDEFWQIQNIVRKEFSGKKRPKELRLFNRSEVKIINPVTY